MNEPAAPSYARKTVWGVAWVTLGVSAGRVSGVVAQFILGWLLSEQDFGLYGIAIAASTIVLTLRSVGVQRILIQRGKEYDALAGPLARMTLVLNSTGAVLLAVAAPGIAQLYDAAELMPLIWLIASSLPLAVPTQVLRAKLSIDMRFGTLVAFDTVSNVGRQLAIIGFALADFGPMSFVLPMPLFAIIDGLVLWAMVGWWPRGRRDSWALWSEFWSSGKWVLLCGAAATLIVQGNTLVLGAFATKAVTGTFFFGFNLTVSLSMLFSASASSVLMPVFSQLADQPERQRQAHLRVIRLMSTIVAPVCVLGALIAPPLIHFLWQGKWDQSAFVTQWFTLVLPIYLMFMVGSATLESRGEWRLNALLHLANGFGTLCAAAVGIAWGGLESIVVTGACYRLLFGLLHGVFVCRYVGHSVSECVQSILPCYLISAIVGWLVWTTSRRWWHHWDSVEQMIVLALAFTLTVLVAYVGLFRERMIEVRGVMRDARGG